MIFPPFLKKLSFSYAPATPPVDGIENFDRFQAELYLESSTGSLDWTGSIFSFYYGNEYFSENFDRFLDGVISTIDFSSKWPKNGYVGYFGSILEVENFDGQVTTQDFNLPIEDRLENFDVYPTGSNSIGIYLYQQA